MTSSRNGDDSVVQTKRALRKLGANPSNTWPQMPKVQSMEARAKAYLRVANLGDSTAKSPKLDPELDLQSPEIRFGRLLASTDQRKRHGAIHSLQNYLKQRTSIENDGGISELDLLKLWKGMWHTLYMADKVPVQDELSKKLANLIWCFEGTLEEDEYAGRTYMEMIQQEEEAFELQEESADKDVVMEELVNTVDPSSTQSNPKNVDNSNTQHDGEDQDDENSTSDSDSDSDSDSVDKDAGDQEGDVDANDQDNHSNKTDEENNGDDDYQDDELDQLQVQHCRGAHLASLFVKTFFQTLLREWFKMDKHRVDKFYTLIRLIVSQVYTYMAQRHWNVGIIRLFNDVLWEQVLSQTPNGVRFHLIDLTLEELAKVNSNEETTAIPLTEATFLDVMDPFIALTQNSDDRVVQARVVDKIWDKFLFHHSVASDTYESDLEDDKKQIMDQVQIKTVMEYIFQMASHETTQDQFRESIYDLYKTYVRKLKSAGRDVVLHQQNMLEDEEEYDVQEDTTKQTDDVEGGETQTEVEINPKDKVIETKKTKKKKKKKKRQLSGPDEAPNDTPTKKTKKAKRSSSEELEQPVKNSDSSEVKQSEEVHSKKKKKKKNHHSDSADDEITISLAEQKKAQAGNVNKKNDKTPSKPRKEKKRTKTEDANDQSRRVSFGKVNRAKSHQASMKALKTCHPTIEPVTAEKGILRNKGVSPKSSGRRKPRRKASDYF